MQEQEILAQQFEEQRPQLRAVAYRMLGSVSEADDAVQEAWFRLALAETAEIVNMAAWLTTVVSRICLDMLRSRAARREQPIDWLADVGSAAVTDPEHEAVLIDSVGRALLVVLDTLGPDERVAFVLHDMFAVPFEQIGPIVGRSTATTKKLASRARRRAQADGTASTAELAEQRHVVDAFLTAARGGDLTALLAVLAPDVVRIADPATLPVGVASMVRGAREVAKETVLLRHRSQVAAAAFINGAVGIVVAPGGRLLLALTVTVADERVTGYEVIANPARLQELEIAVLPNFS